MIKDALTIIIICILVLSVLSPMYPLVLLNTFWFVGSYNGLVTYTLAYINIYLPIYTLVDNKLITPDRAQEVVK